MDQKCVCETYGFISHLYIPISICVCIEMILWEESNLYINHNIQYICESFSVHLLLMRLFWPHKQHPSFSHSHQVSCVSSRSTSALFTFSLFVSTIGGHMKWTSVKYSVFVTLDLARMAITNNQDYGGYVPQVGLPCCGWSLPRVVHRPSRAHPLPAGEAASFTEKVPGHCVPVWPRPWSAGEGHFSGTGEFSRTVI